MGKILVVAEKPSAGSDMAKVLGCTERKDGYFENAKAFGCSGYSEGCTFAIWKTIAGKTITSAQAKQLLQKRKCGPIKGFKGSKGTFAAYLVMKQDNTIGFTFK